jgi:hypothetical protein
VLRRLGAACLLSSMVALLGTVLVAYFAGGCIHNSAFRLLTALAGDPMPAARDSAGPGIWHYIGRYANLLASAAVYSVVAGGLLSLCLIIFARPEDSETKCRKCGYILRGLPEPRCPECGERI